MSSFAVRQFNGQVELAFDGELLGTFTPIKAMIIGEVLINEAMAANLTINEEDVPPGLVHLAHQKIGKVAVWADGCRVVFSWANGAKHVVLSPDASDSLGRLIHKCGSLAYDNMPPEDHDFGIDAKMFSD